MEALFNLLEILASKSNSYSFSFDYSSICDYTLTVYKSEKIGWYETIFSIQDSDRNLVFSKAYIKLAEFMCETYGGY